MRVSRILVVSLAGSLIGCSVATPTDSTASRPSASAGHPTSVASPSPTLPSPLPDGALDLAAFGWHTVVPEFEPATGDTIGYWLAVGSLAAEAPAWFEPMTLRPWVFDEEAPFHPVTDGPAGGRVVHVADDGKTSELRALEIGGTDLGAIGSTPHVIHTVRLTPDGEVVYAVLRDRVTGADLGVFRASLADGGTIEPVMDPPAVDNASDIRMVAVRRFVRILRISADGSEVARLACGEPFGQCVLDVLTVSDGIVRTYDAPGQSGDLVAIGDGVALGGSSCIGDGSRCVTSGVELASGMQREYPGQPAVLDEDGRLALLQFPSPAIETNEFAAVQLNGVGPQVIFTTDGTVRPLYQEGIDFQGVRVELPPGWVPISHARQDADGGYETFVAAVRLRDGGWVRLAVPTILPIGGGHD